MIRVLGALAAVVLPTLVLAFLLAAQLLAWSGCQAAALGSAAHPAGLLSAVTATLFATPLRPFWLAAPFALFGLLLILARGRTPRRILLLGEALFLGAVIVWLWPVPPPDGCALPPPDPFLTAARLLPAGLLAALLVNKINCLAGACRP